MSMPKRPLSDSQVREILHLREEQGMTLAAIAKQFGCDFQTISRIVRGEAYRHITAGDAGRLKKLRREQNAAILADAYLMGVCLQCGVSVRVKAETFVSRPDSVLCAKHDRRRKVPAPVQNPGPLEDGQG